MNTDNSERAKLEQAIALLESQREMFGDVAADVSIAALRAKIAALENPPVLAEQRKQATVLFADIAGFTAFSETIDAEEVTTMVNALWQRLDHVINAHGGKIDKHMGDAVMALWGMPVAHEDDPEQAIRAALAMQNEINAFMAAQQRAIQMRIGINTGTVMLSAVGTQGEFTAMGDAVNVAARIEHAAPVGGILVSHDTYRHVRGAFEMRSQDLLTVKGKSEPLQTYLVLGPKPRIFRRYTRGVEGIETRMIGRQPELDALRDTLRAVMQEKTLHVITIVGDAGIGKSRLLYEFDNWRDLQPERFRVFRARASEETYRLPYAFLRDMFAFRFGMSESETLSDARAKLEDGIAALMRDDADARMKAHFIGHLLGLDFSSSPYLAGLVGETKALRERALFYLAQFFRAVSQTQGMSAAVLLLEDLHWADDNSLDALMYLMQACRQAPVLMVALARPPLFEHYPKWSAGSPANVQIELQPLSLDESRQLVDEILQKVPHIPQALRELIISGAEGNPFYVEELVKMLIEEQVILPDADEWRVAPERLVTVHVPPTLVGILQARLDALPEAERETLQRAAVVGRIFWDSAVAALGSDAPDELRARLNALRRRELIFKRNLSLFEHADEYIFKHTLLRDVAYETVLKRLRRTYHARAAQWLIDFSGERADEYAGLIAEHFERAEESDQAAHWYARAGNVSAARSAFRTAAAQYERALALTARDAPQWSELARLLGEMQLRLGIMPAARHSLNDAVSAAQNDADRAVALAVLAEWCGSSGDYAQSHELLMQALPLARACGDRATLARALDELGGVHWQLGELDEARAAFNECLDIARALGDVTRELSALNRLGAVALSFGDIAQAEDLWRQVYERGIAVGNRERAMVALNNLGSAANERLDYAAARAYFRQALQLAREIGSQRSAALYVMNLARTNLDLGEWAQAREGLREGLELALRSGAQPWVVGAVMYFADLYYAEGRVEDALALYGLAQRQPAWSSDHQRGMDENLARWNLDPALVQDGLKRGAQADWDATLLQLVKQE